MAIRTNENGIAPRTSSKEWDIYRYIGAAIPVLAAKQAAANVHDPADPYQIPIDARLASAEWIGLMLTMRGWLINDLCNVLSERKTTIFDHDPPYAEPLLRAWRANERTADAEHHVAGDISRLARLIWIVTGDSEDYRRAVALGVPEYVMRETSPLTGGDPHSFIAGQFPLHPQPIFTGD